MFYCINIVNNFTALPYINLRPLMLKKFEQFMYTYYFFKMRV